LRIIEPQAGKIYVDDVDITELGLDDLRSKITIIPQVDWILRFWFNKLKGPIIV